ncbi:MAG: fasciclin domain-containing protein [Deltaproteobacteria bacterium]|nr:fasciclin domain-containing protein [Deltaproteobacteria bacterium]
MKTFNGMTTLGLGLGLLVTAACGTDEKPQPNPSPGNIVEVAGGAGFSKLIAAARQAGLAETLAGPGPFTVFAPTDAAFDALGAAVPSNPKLLANILLHHVVSESLASSDVVAMGSFPTMANTRLVVDATARPITIGGSALSGSIDIMASNGIIHVMEEVIVPPTIVEIAAATEALSTLVGAVGAASEGVRRALAPNTLGGDAPITVFAPTNEAFAALGIDLGSLNQATLDGVLAHHVLPTQGLSTDLRDGATLTTLNGDLRVVVDPDGTIGLIDGRSNRANVISTLKDIRALTGIVHVIDRVLMP